jgi:hypothetical protein
MTLDPHVFYLSGNRVQHLAWLGRWVSDDLFSALPPDQQQKVPPPLSGIGIAAMGTGGNLDPRVYYLAPPSAGTSGNRVEQLAWVGSWVWNDLFSALPSDQNHRLRQGQHTPFQNSGLAAMGTGGNLDPRVYYIDENGRVQELAWVGRWVWNDLFSELPSNQIPKVHKARMFAIAAMGTGANRDSRVYYLDNTGRVQQLAWVGHWVWDDLFSELPPHQRQQVQNADANSILAVMGTGDNLDPHVFYLDVHGNVQHLAWLGNHWEIEIPDVSHSPFHPPAPPAMSGSNLAVMARYNNLEMHVFYVDQQHRHVQHLAWVGHNWALEDVNVQSGAQHNAFFAGGLAVMGTGGNRDPRVFYLDDNRDVWQLAWIGDTPWPAGSNFWAQPVNVTGTDGAPKAGDVAFVAMGTGR